MILRRLYGIERNNIRENRYLQQNFVVNSPRDAIIFLMLQLTTVNRTFTLSTRSIGFRRVTNFLWARWAQMVEHQLHDCELRIEEGMDGVSAAATYDGVAVNGRDSGLGVHSPRAIGGVLVAA